VEPRYDRGGLPEMPPDSRVFIIDDDPAILRALDRLFRASGFAVETFSSPGSFLERARSDETGCLVLDLRMPELSGLDVQQAMSRKGLSIPIVFLRRPGRRGVHREGDARGRRRLSRETGGRRAAARGRVARAGHFEDGGSTAASRTTCATAWPA
jgi:CheY-like chemotaxis protein